MAVIKIGVDNLPERDKVELFGHTFTVRRVTRSVQKNLEAVDKKLRTMDENADGDRIVAAISDGLDAMLEPNGSKTPAKQVLSEAWKKDDLDLVQVQTLYEQVQESGAKRPPTSEAAS
jgi:hypothetical protein